MPGEVHVSLEQIYEEVKALRDDVRTLTHRDEADFQKITDHEARLRVLERVAWTALGVGGLSLADLVFRAMAGG